MSNRTTKQQELSVKQQELSALLQRSCLKVTVPRLAVLSLMEAHRDPMDAERVYQLLSDAGTPLNLSTVYRVLEQFSGKGLLRKTWMTPGETRAMFEWEDGRHTHHFRCTECRALIPIPGCPIHELERTLAETMNIEVTGHRLELFGRCSSCRFDSPTLK